MATTPSPVWRCRRERITAVSCRNKCDQPRPNTPGTDQKVYLPGGGRHCYTRICAEAKTAHTNTHTHRDTHTCTVLVRRGERGPGCLPSVLFPSRTFLTKEFKRFKDSLKEEAGPKGWSLEGRVTFQADRSWLGLLPLFKLHEPAKPSSLFSCPPPPQRSRLLLRNRGRCH